MGMGSSALLHTIANIYLGEAKSQDKNGYCNSSLRSGWKTARDLTYSAFSTYCTITWFFLLHTFSTYCTTFSTYCFKFLHVSISWKI